MTDYSKHTHSLDNWQTKGVCVCMCVCVISKNRSSLPLIYPSELIIHLFFLFSTSQFSRHIKPSVTNITINSHHVCKELKTSITINDNLLKHFNNNCEIVVI